MSVEQASAESMFKFSRDRANSELLRPWAASLVAKPSANELSQGQSSGATLSNLIRRASSGSVDLCIQSVDLISSDSTVSEALTDNGAQSGR